MIKFAVFASGSGTNFQAIIDAIKSGKIRGRIKILITDNPKAGAIKRAEKAKIPVEIIQRQEFDEYGEYATAMVNILSEEAVDLIVLAGYMKKIPSYIVENYRNKIINIHPALIPAFCGKGYYGLKVHKAAIDYGVKVSGITVHFVDEKYDHGPIIAQSTVRVDSDDTPASLQKKIQKLEHRILPEVISLFANGRISVEGRIVKIESDYTEGLFNK